jgi:dTDP-4-dehydrorhamnose reductase
LASVWRCQLGRSLQTVLTGHQLTALDHGRLDITKLADVREPIAAYRPAVLINAAAYNNVDGGAGRRTEKENGDEDAISALQTRE